MYFNSMRVSVVLPFFNADYTLQRAVDSVLEQSEPCELILVDNNPSPSEVARSLAHNSNQINLIHEPRKGIVNALNAGIEAASCDYIARMDADDIMLPNRLKLQADYLDAHPHIKLVSGMVEYAGNIDDARGYAEYVDQINSIQSTEHIFRYRFIEAPVAHPSVMFRKSITDRVPVYREGPFPEDYELWLHVLQEHPYSFAKLPVPVLRWFDSAQRLSRHHASYSEEAFSRIRLNYLAEWLIKQGNHQRPILIVGGGKKAKQKIKYLLDCGVTMSAFSDLKPRKIEGLTFIPWTEVSPQLGYYLVSLVSNRHAWKIIENELVARCFNPETDFILAG
jgi:glycosyltransferase involved in cell wall biosynthesis